MFSKSKKPIREDQLSLFARRGEVAHGQATYTQRPYGQASYRHAQTAQYATAPSNQSPYSQAQLNRGPYGMTGYNYGPIASRPVPAAAASKSVKQVDTIDLKNHKKREKELAKRMKEVEKKKKEDEKLVKAHEKQLRKQEKAEVQAKAHWGKR